MKRSTFCGTLINAFIGLPSRTRQLQRDREAKIGNEWKRMRRVDGERSQHRKDVLQKIVSSQARSGFLKRVPVDQDDTFSSKFLTQLLPPLQLVTCQHGHRIGDAAELLGWGQPIRTLGGDALAYLPFKAGNPHHEKFVEVVG